MALAGVLSKELLHRQTLRIGLAAHSPALLANAVHHRTDALCSVVALAGSVLNRTPTEIGLHPHHLPPLE